MYDVPTTLHMYNISILMKIIVKHTVVYEVSKKGVGVGTIALFASQFKVYLFQLLQTNNYKVVKLPILNMLKYKK